MTELENKITATILGGAIGDALGVPVEFKARDTFKVTAMIGHGTYNQPKGTWSDDTSLTLCLIENIIESGNEESLMKKFSNYYTHGYMTPHGECFDIGGTTVRAINSFMVGTLVDKCGQFGENDNGNGSLMRIAPVAFLNIAEETAISRIAKVEQYSIITHAHPRSVFGCFIYTEYLRQLYLGKTKTEALEIITDIHSVKLYETMFKIELSQYSRILNKEIGNVQRESIRSGGYIVDTLEAALWCFLKHDNYRDTVLEAINLGGDTDTTGIVAGSLAGMYYGLDGLPNEWINALARIDYIKELCAKFSNVCKYEKKKSFTK